MSATCVVVTKGTNLKVLRYTAIGSLSWREVSRLPGYGSNLQDGQQNFFQDYMHRDIFARLHSKISSEKYVKFANHDP